MKHLSILIISICILVFCCSCTAEPEAAPPVSTESTPCTETEPSVHDHTFGSWTYGQDQMQRVCSTCGETQLRDMTDEEHFRHALQGHWQPYEVTLEERTQPIYSVRNSVWNYYADYAGDDLLICTYSTGFSRSLTLQYSHFDAQSSIHHATAVSEDGLPFRIALEMRHAEPLLCLETEPGADLFERVVFSQYRQIASVAIGTWSGISGGQIASITLNSDQTFTSTLEGISSGTWQLSHGGDDNAIGAVQLFYRQGNRSMSNLAAFYSQPVELPELSVDPPDFSLELDMPSQIWQLHKLQPEQLQPLMDKGSNAIIGTWDSKSIRSFSGEDTAPHIRTGYTLTISEDGTFTLLSDSQLSGTWSANGSYTSNGTVYYSYLFTYPGSQSGGDQASFNTNSGNLSIPYRMGKIYSNLTFVRYNAEQWADFLAGPQRLPGSYVSQKIIRFDASGQSVEEPETGYTLTIGEDGSVTGMLHQAVSGRWYYDDLAVEDGHRYIFRMDHTPPEQVSDLRDDGTLLFDTKLDGEHVVIYFVRSDASDHT